MIPAIILVLILGWGTQRAYNYNRGHVILTASEMAETRIDQRIAALEDASPGEYELDISEYCTLEGLKFDELSDCERYMSVEMRYTEERCLVAEAMQSIDFDRALTVQDESIQYCF